MLKKLGLSVLLLLGHGAADAAERNFTLHINDGDLTITGAGGTILSIWGYGESAVFADYNPQYFLLSGKEGKTTGSPGQRADLLITLPSTSGAWYPQVVYKNCAITRLTRPFTAKSLFKRARFG